jgi:hypothetical protein
VQTENPACSTGEERAESVAKRKRKEPKNKKSPHFTDEETKAIWSEEEVYQQLRKPGMKRPVWEKIAKEMKKQGYNRTADQCKERIRALEKKYKKIKEDMNETGKGNNSDSFPYFDAPDEILGTNPSVSPSFLIDLEEPLSVVAASIRSSRSGSPSEMPECVDPSDSSSSRITAATNTSPKDAATQRKEKGRQASWGSSHGKDDIASRMEVRLAAMEDRLVEKQMKCEEELMLERIKAEEQQEKQQEFFLQTF